MSQQPPNRRVLLVELDRDVRTALDVLLTRAGLTVASTDDGRAARRLFALRPDVLITDLRSAAIGAGALVHEMRASTPGVKVVATGTVADHETLGSRVSADRVFVHPIDVEELVEYLGVTPSVN
jgi:DNA-binding response OmpR family regulator